MCGVKKDKFSSCDIIEQTTTKILIYGGVHELHNTKNQLG